LKKLIILFSAQILFFVPLQRVLLLQGGTSGFSVHLALVGLFLLPFFAGVLVTMMSPAQTPAAAIARTSVYK
jgi:hypothetical protein